MRCRNKRAQPAGGQAGAARAASIPGEKGQSHSASVATAAIAINQGIINPMSETRSAARLFVGLGAVEQPNQDHRHHQKHNGNAQDRTQQFVRMAHLVPSTAISTATVSSISRPIRVPLSPGFFRMGVRTTFFSTVVDPNPGARVVLIERFFPSAGAANVPNNEGHNQDYKRAKKEKSQTETSSENGENHV